MDDQYILPIILGIGIGMLLVAIIYLIYKLSCNRYSLKPERLKRSTNCTPTIFPHDIPGFSLPITRKIPVQEPIRSPTRCLSDEYSSEEYETEKRRTRSSHNLPVSTVLEASQSYPDFSIMEPMSPLKRKSISSKLSGSISMQDLNVYSPKRSSRFVSISEDELAVLKFAMYYSVASSELNVTVLSVNNITQLTQVSDKPSLCVWVQVEFSRYHQEFKTKCSSMLNEEATFHETCVVSEFPADLFNGTKISFRVFDGATVLAEAVHKVLGLPPSFPRNKTLELQHPGIVQMNNSSKFGEILIRLKYDPVDESVTLGIVECRGLTCFNKKKKPLDTYVKVHIIFCDEIVQRIKTKTVAKCNNPSYKETFKLSGFFSRGKMRQVLVKLTVFTKTIKKQGLGYVFLGTGRQNDITASGYQHWETIIDKPELDIAQWHSLKPARTMTP